MAAQFNTIRVNTQGVSGTNRSWRPGIGPAQTYVVSKKQRTEAQQPKTTMYGLIAGKRIKAAREALGLSQDGLSERTGKKLGGRRIGNWEQGTREVGIQEAIILGEALGEPPAYLMGLVDDVDRRLLKLDLSAKSAALTLASANVAQQTAISGDRPKDAIVLPAELQRSPGSRRAHASR